MGAGKDRLASDLRQRLREGRDAVRAGNPFASPLPCPLEDLPHKSPVIERLFG